MHGKLSHIQHGGDGVFDGLPDPLTVTRYHSLVIAPDSMPDCLDIAAQTDDGIIMAVKHKSRPVYGVQFHPESIATAHGHKLLGNFLTGRRYECGGRHCPATFEFGGLDGRAAR